jgi:hypothetical protein
MFYAYMVQRSENPAYFNGTTILSIVISALSTGWTISSLSFQWDVDPSRRSVTPSFYGYVPDSATSRGLVFGLVAAFSALLLLCRCSSIALLCVANMRWFFGVFAAESVAYLALKAARGELAHWVRLDGVMGVFLSVIARLSIKWVTDFTGFPQSRGPGEMGGAIYS